MPFLPMKYPEYRLSMEASMPSSVHCWFTQELELRGIDSLVYTRYIISLLLQDGEDIECLEADLDSFPKCKRKGRRSDKRKQVSTSDEERKKFAAIQCLSAVTDEKSGIETLVEELCSRLKDSEIEASLNRNVKSRSCSSDGSDDSSTENQNPAQRYYAAFPALHGQGVSTKTSPSETIWRNNPLVKSHASLTSEEDSSSANEDAEIRKINHQGSIAIPKQRKPRKSSSGTKKDHVYNKRQASKSSDSTGQRGGRKGSRILAEQQDFQQQDFVPWPPGFARMDPVLVGSYETWPENYVETVQLAPRKSKNELCTKVESLLKGMLLPAPEKTYKDLQDVDDDTPEEFRQMLEKKSIIPVTSSVENRTLLKGNDLCCTEEYTGTACTDFSDVVPPSPRGESVSPELQEQEIWYTQPIDVIFQSQDDEVSSSKLRLYKRSSDPSVSPDPDSFSELSDGGHPSPVDYARNRSTSFTSDKSDDILEGSLLIPSWLTEVISGDESKLDDNDVDACHQQSHLKSSSPCLQRNERGIVINSDVYQHEAQLADQKYQNQFHDNNSTPTPENKDNLLQEPAMSVSLVDLDYMSKFLLGSHEWHACSPEDTFSLNNARRNSITALWQSQVLFDYSLNISDTFHCFEDPLLEPYDVQCWQPLGTRPFSQLWDVNMQKRSKMSLWGQQVFPSGNQVWLEEKTLVFLLSGTDLEPGEESTNEGENTLIPRISIDIVAEEDAMSFPAEEESIDPDSYAGNYFDRSVSMGDVPSLWEDDNSYTGNPKLSKSFELVPSEHSAFKDVPRKLIHVHSEPNLVQFRQDFGEGDQVSASSPHEHLYYSPKTHFRPITPAYAPEPLPSRLKQQVCQDLFGGLPSTKSPYQQYQVADRDSEQEGFIPSFKVKNASKSIQTGDSFDKVDSPSSSDDTPERDTPETLTLSIIEDVIEEKVDQLITIAEDLDGANTDSAYETDYGGNQGVDCEHDMPHHSHCCQAAMFEGDIELFGIPNVDHGHLGDITNFTIDSFEATYPHTNDWPEVPPTAYHWADAEKEKHKENLPTAEYVAGEKDQSYTVGSYPGSTGIWNEDLGLDHLYKECEMERYKNIWSSAGNDYYSFEAGLTSGSAVNENYHAADDEYDNIPREDFYTNLVHEEYEGTKLFEYPLAEVFETGLESLIESQEEMPFPTYAEFPDHEGSVQQGELKTSSKVDGGDYFRVKLVYKNQKPTDGDLQQVQGYGDCDLIPMPEEAVMSTVLEEQWRDPKFRAAWASSKPSSLQRKPCSFYLEGNCRRADCKFAHDISNITCRFWEEGGCFKGPLCPFLHGYPRPVSPRTENPSPAETDRQRFSLNKEEFPELSVTLKSSRNNCSGPKKQKSLKSQKADATPAGRREKGRKSNGRRHSNKENLCEVKIVNKCSSSI